MTTKSNNTGKQSSTPSKKAKKKAKKKAPVKDNSILIHGQGVPPSAPLTGSDGEVSYPVYPDSFGITLILNTEAFPILGEDGVRTATTKMVETFVSKINGYRSLAEQRAAIEISRMEDQNRLAKVKSDLQREKAVALLRIMDEKDEKGKPRYGADYKAKAAFDAFALTDSGLAQLDQESFQLETNIRGYTAKIEALKLHMSAHREEIVAVRDAISHLVNSGLVAVAGIPMEDEIFDDGQLDE